MRLRNQLGESKRRLYEMLSKVYMRLTGLSKQSEESQSKERHESKEALSKATQQLKQTKGNSSYISDKAKRIQNRTRSDEFAEAVIKAIRGEG